ncbi:MAG TPA: 50S ribosomal protein L24 [Candidatus Acidoferrales bacterium]|nr:50S ribosomal protein L24 [Candidatus Acidoferrales bacterium]
MIVAGMAKTLLRRGDTVMVIAGRDKGKTGKVLSVEAGRVTVERVNVIKRHTRANPSKNIRGGILEKESPVHLSNVMIVCPGCGKHSRIGRNVLPDGTRARVCRRCNTTLDQ